MAPRPLIIDAQILQSPSTNLRKLALDSRVELEVSNCSRQAAEPGVDPEFGVRAPWKANSYLLPKPTTLMVFILVSSKLDRPGVRLFLQLGHISPPCSDFPEEGRARKLVFWILNESMLHNTQGLHPT